MKNSLRKRAPKINGIGADARALNVTRQHLWCVLTGRRESAPLLRRYRTLQRSKRNAGRHSTP